MSTRKTLRLALALVLVAFSLPAVPADAGPFDLPKVEIDLPELPDGDWVPELPDWVPTPPNPGDTGHLPQPSDGPILLSPEDLSSRPLAEAIWASRNRARRSCRPLPPHVAADLSSFFPANVIRGVCYSTDWGATQNGTLQQVVLGNGQADAIALGDVIVFAHPSLLNNRWLWAHEMRHIEQYADLGVEEFANEYMWNSQGLEADADRFANRVMSYPVQGTSWNGR